MNKAFHFRLGKDRYMKKVLITGADGFTGSYLSKLLSDSGYDVIGTSFSFDESGKYIQLDLSNKLAVDSIVDEVQPDYIVHLAGLSFVAHDCYQSFYDVNLFGTMNLLNSVADKCDNIKKIVIASSANVYGDVPEGQVLRESFPPLPVSHYGMSKLAMEYMSKQFNALPIIITRPMNYTGPGQDVRFLVPKIVDHFVRGCDVIELGNLDVYRDFSDVRDVARYYLGLIESNCTTGVFNLCSGSLFSILDIVKLLENISGRSIEIRVNEMFVRDNEIKVLAGDPTLLNDSIGVRPLYGMKDTLEYMYFSSIKKKL